MALISSAAASDPANSLEAIGQRSEVPASGHSISSSVQKQMSQPRTNIVPVELLHDVQTSSSEQGPVLQKARAIPAWAAGVRS